MADDVARTAATAGRAFLSGLPVAGAAFTVMTSDALRDTVYASDAVIAAIADLQYGVGEGPALSAFTGHRPVLIADLSASGPAARWPEFTRQVAASGAGSLFAFPMQLGAITVGVCETYRREPGPLDRDEVTLVLRAVDLATVSLLALRAGELAAGDVEPDAGWLDGHGGSRALVHQATGMLTAQLGVDLTEAFGRLRAHAYAAERSIEQIAGDIVERRLRLDRDPK